MATKDSQEQSDILLAFQGKNKHVPVWFMRQAGRYLPEYKELRRNAKDFLNFCYTPAMASEATLQPVRRFGMSGAIVFSDILVVPDALGVDVRFEEGEGPVLAPVQDEKKLDGLRADPPKLLPVYEALRMTKSALPSETALIGFAGAPWTLACYVVQGKADRDFQQVRSIAMARRRFFERLIGVLTKAVAEHAIKQIEAGAEVIQLFDSWSGILSEQEFSDWVIAPTKKIVQEIKSKHPHVPIIGFPRQAGEKYRAYVLETKVDAVNIDASVSLAWARDVLQEICVVQGNLDPVLLAGDKEAMLAQARHIVSMLGDKPFVFNLGHGILPHTPIENVMALSGLLKNDI